jgi:type IV fimbrial biogenesis protein FimT
MKRQKGFTLTEMIVVSAIVAILLGIGVPSYRYITNSYRMSAEVNSLLGDMQYARAESVREGQFVTVCISRTPYTSCDGGSTTWQEGWIVFSDPNGNGIVDAGEAILKVQQAFLRGATAQDSFVDAANGIAAVTYNREGFATTQAGFPDTSITLHDPTANAVWTRCLWINPMGVPRVAMTTTAPESAGQVCN